MSVRFRAEADSTDHEKMALRAVRKEKEAEGRRCAPPLFIGKRQRKHLGSDLPLPVCKLLDFMVYCCQNYRRGKEVEP